MMSICERGAGEETGRAAVCVHALSALLFRA